MKKALLIILFIYAGNSLFAQMPFSTYVKPTSESVQAKFIKKNGRAITATNDSAINSLKTRNIYLARNLSNPNNVNIESDQNVILANTSRIALLEIENKKLVSALAKEELQQVGKPEFLDHLNANIVTLQNGKKMFPTINGEVINYKLSVWTKYKIANGDTQRIPHYLPISLITKVSGNYVDSSAGASDDATSYFGAPLTLRFSPSVELFKNHLNDNRLFAGFNADMRLLTIVDNAVKGKLQTTWGVYGSAGLSYMGRGYAYDGDDDTDAAKRHDGVWSFSAMVYFFKSGGEYNKAIFGDYEKKTLSGAELMLRFKTSKKEDAKFNFLMGASNCFTKGGPNTGGWQFKLGIGN